MTNEQMTRAVLDLLTDTPQTADSLWDQAGDLTMNEVRQSLDDLMNDNRAHAVTVRGSDATGYCLGRYPATLYDQDGRPFAVMGH